jgi:hypothetical protein
VIDAIYKPLGGCAEIRSGYPFRGPVEPVASGGALVAQMKDIDPFGGLRWETLVRTELPGRKAPDWLQVGDILFVPRGSRFFAASIDAPPEPAVCGPHLVHLRLCASVGVLPAFLAWQINQPPLQRRLRAAAEGSSQLSIRIAEIEALQIAIPPLAKQMRIVALAEAVLRERQVLARLIQNREQELASLANTLAHATGPDTH